ncbi:tetratricopeptide repeat protein, partial [Natronospira sp.]
PLRLAARLAADSAQAGDVLSDAIRFGFDDQTPALDRRLTWSVAAQAAEKTGNRSARIGALERGLGLYDEGGRVDPVFSLAPEQLWAAYQDFGERLGNEAQILVGDDPMWFELAESYADSEPVKTRALLSVIAFNSFETKQRERAHGELAATLVNRREGPAIIRQLYLESGHFQALDSIPQTVRYLLADLVMEEADIPLASRLMRGLDKAPDGVEELDWGLRRARVLLLGGAREEGLSALDALFDKDVEDFPVERVLQVLFDLQNMGDHEPALAYLKRLLEKDLEDRQHREILFWMAESAEGMGDRLEAARLYLRSAGFHDPFSMDQWAQTARYRAADALADAGLTEDARRLYQSLLNATEDEARRSVLRNRIQRLRLQPASPPGPEIDP